MGGMGPAGNGWLPTPSSPGGTPSASPLPWVQPYTLHQAVSSIRCQCPRRRDDRPMAMSETIPSASAETITAWAGSRSLQLGRSYFENGAVFDLRRQGSSLKARCQGSMPQPYRLRVTFGAQGIEEAHCSCPVGRGGRCKHVGALLLAWLDQPDAFRTVLELDADLEQRGKDELIALIKRMLRLEPDLETLLEETPPGGDRPRTPVDPETYRRQVSYAFRRGGNDWMAYRRTAEDIDGIVNAGDDFLALDDGASASVVYQATARGILEHYDPGFDEEWNLGGVVDRCVEGLGDCLVSMDDDARGREQTLQALFEIYRHDVDCGGIGLGEAAPVLILEHASEGERRTVAGWVRNAMGRGDDYHRRAHGRFLLELESDDLDDDAFLGICRESGLLADLVDRLLTIGRLDEALSEARRAGDHQLLILADVFLRHGCSPSVEPLLVRRMETGQDHRLAEWLKARHRERGELAEALALAKRLLLARPHLAGYQEVRELSLQLASGGNCVRTFWPSGPPPDGTICSPTFTWRRATSTWP